MLARRSALVPWLARARSLRQRKFRGPVSGGIPWRTEMGRQRQRPRAGNRPHSKFLSCTMAVLLLGETGGITCPLCGRDSGGCPSGLKSSSYVH